MQAWPILAVFVLGIANQQGSTCAVAAADQIVQERRFGKLAGFALAAAVSATVLSLLGAMPARAGAVTWTAAIGGVIAACGASLNGRCAMGTIASLGRGRLDRIGTLGGFFLGALAVALLSFAPKAAGHGPAAAATMIPVLAAIAAAGLAWYLARGPRLLDRIWMALIGLLNAVLIAAMVGWSYTSNLSALAKGGTVDPVPAGLYLAALVAGCVVAAFAAGTFRYRRSPPRDWLRSVSGGALMGAGAALVPGGNDTMLLLGVPLLLPGLLLAYACFWAALLALRWRKARWTS